LSDKLLHPSAGQTDKCGGNSEKVDLVARLLSHRRVTT